MSYRYLFLLFLIVLSSCKGDKEEVEPLTEKQLQKLDMTAVSMMDALATNQPEVVMQRFDHRSFSRRLGKKFFSFKKEEQGVIMGILINLLGEEIYELAQNISKNELVLEMVDARQKNRVSQVTIAVMDTQAETIITYLVLYLKENTEGEFVLVNYYDVYSGKSFAQIAKDILAVDIENKRITRLFEKEKYRNLEAKHLERLGNYEEAYMQMDSTSSEFKNIGTFPVYRALLASQVSDSLYLQELENLKEVTPNEQSVLFYDCISTAIKTGDPDQAECLEGFLTQLLNK